MKKSVLILGLMVAFPAFAQQGEKPKQENGKKPSEILEMIEKRPDFARLDKMSWDDDGCYEIVYRTNDKAKVEIDINPAGQPVDHR